MFPKIGNIVLYILGLLIFLVILLIACYVHDFLKNRLIHKRKQENE